jgi:hypothetical protein
MPYIKIELTIFEKSFDKREYSKSFIMTDLTIKRINKTLAKKTLLRLVNLFGDYNERKKNV